MSSRTKWSLRSLYVAFDRHPTLEAGLEVIFNIIVAFAPFLIIALAKSEATSQILPAFWSFFTAGEIVISLFSTCATVLWLTFFRPNKIKSTISKFTVLTIVVLGILFSGVTIGENVGFKDEMSPYSQNKVLSIYIISLFIWFLVSISNAGATSGESRDPAKDIDAKFLGKDR